MNNTTNNTAFNLLVIEDESLIIDSLKLILPKNWKMVTLSEPIIPSNSHIFHAAFVDMHLKGSLKTAEGPDVIKKILEQNSKIEVVAMSGDLSLELMEKCLKAGAGKFLAKPLLPDEVISTLEKIEALWQMRTAESRGTRQYQWYGSSQASDEIKRKIAGLRGEPGPILIEGETGTGKEVAFRLLNQQEPNRPTVMVNIAAIPENLFESEMFGHVKGAFTGADSMKIGLAEAAHGGDLFLDEIEALPMNQQVKLLRFLETGEIRKVGAKESTIIKTRVIAASNQKLSQLVKETKFREDLLFRVSGKKLLLPPLRERKEDIPELAKQFLSLQKPRSNKMFATEAIEVLKSYTWPGNVRELKRICEQLALTAPLPIIRAEDVRPLIRGISEGSDANTTSAAATQDLTPGLAALMIIQEAEIIKQAIKQCTDVEKAAELLKISRSTLYLKMKNHNIQGPA
jgi:DNA-binding NtrC family response regulator